MRRVVILGTGTNVGKTYVAAGLARALRQRDPTAAVLALKPIESGVAPHTQAPPDQLTPHPGTDANELARVSTPPLPAPNPLYALAEPLSPHLAARRAGLTISLDRVAAWLASAEAALHSETSYLVVETAGGALTPLTPTATNVDLAAAIPKAVWVLVAPDSLGVLHDVAATRHALHSLGHRADYLILAQSRPADRSTGTNAAELRLLHPDIPILPLRRNSADALDTLANELTHRFN
ncbi:MAG: dethiobiotin synthase [Polyangiaceae bacterium]|nr:dethiobiotin synthase [Polyangiaceae bacterium]